MRKKRVHVRVTINTLYFCSPSFNLVFTPAISVSIDVAFTIFRSSGLLYEETLNNAAMADAVVNQFSNFVNKFCIFSNIQICFKQLKVYIFFLLTFLNDNHHFWFL